MGAVKNWMMNIEEFCDGYFYGEGEIDFTVEEGGTDLGDIVVDAKMFN